MRDVRIAKRYAKALILVSSQESEWGQIESELKILAQVYAQTSFLKNFFENPEFKPEERIQFIRELKLSVHTQNCLELLVIRHRMMILPALCQTYIQELDNKLGRIRAIVTTARALTSEQISEIVGALFKRLGKEVLPQTEIHPKVLGGVRVQIGGLVFDGTLETQFSQLQRDLCN